MARTARLAAAATLALVLVAATSAARLPDPFEDHTAMWGQGGGGMQDFLASHRSHSSGDNKGHKAYVAFRYLVPASEHCKFVKEWEKFASSVRKEDGNVIFDLKKTLTDNIVFVGYAEWSCEKNVAKHVETGHAKEWLKYLIENDIIVKVEPLWNPSDCEKKGNAFDNKGGVAFLSKALVAPHSQIGFVKAWEDTAKAAEKAKGNKVYSLRKAVTDDVGFYIYSSWDKFEDAMDFVKSKDAEEFGEFVKKHNVVIFSAPLLG